MIYKFKSKSSGDVIMLGPNGDEVLRLIGKTPAAQGIIETAAMPAAIAAIERAVAADEAASKGNDADDAAKARGGVSLRQRAWPLVDMMKRSQADDNDVVWGV